MYTMYASASNNTSSRIRLVCMWYEQSPQDVSQTTRSIFVT